MQKVEKTAWVVSAEIDAVLNKMADDIKNQHEATDTMQEESQKILTKVRGDNCQLCSWIYSCKSWQFKSSFTKHFQCFEIYVSDKMHLSNAKLKPAQNQIISNGPGLQIWAFLQFTNQKLNLKRKSKVELHVHESDDNRTSHSGTNFFCIYSLISCGMGKEESLEMLSG